LIPLKVPLHDDNAPILDDIHKDPLAEQLLNPPIDDHVVAALMSPLHIGQLSAILVLELLILELLLPMLLHIEAIWLYDWDVGGWADVKRCGVLLLVCALLGTSNLKETVKGQCLEDAATHIFLILVKYIKN
jgi:hypothetical protein